MENIPAAIEKKEEKKGGALRGRFSSKNRLIGAMMLSAAAVLGAPDAEAGRRGDIAGGVIGGAIIGAVVMHAIESKSSGMEVNIDENTMMALNRMGVHYNSMNKSLIAGNQKIALESGRRKDKSVSIRVLTPNQFMLTYIYLDDSDQKYHQKCLVSLEGGRVVVGQATPVKEQ